MRTRRARLGVMQGLWRMLSFREGIFRQDGIAELKRWLVRRWADRDVGSRWIGWILELTAIVVGIDRGLEYALAVAALGNVARIVVGWLDLRYLHATAYYAYYTGLLAPAHVKIIGGKKK